MQEAGDGQGTDYGSTLDTIFFQTIVRHRMETAEAEVVDLHDAEAEMAAEEFDLLFAWGELCSVGDRVLGQEMVRETEWAEHGMMFANDRLALLHFSDFERFLGLTDPFLDFTVMQLTELSSEDIKTYRSILTTYAIQEVYFWMAAVWDRMGHFLNLFAFGIKNVSKSTDGWRQVFARFRANYGDEDAFANDRYYRTLQRLNNKAYEKVYRRRNLLAHKGSLAGRIQAGSEENEEHSALYRRFVLGNEAWDLSNVVRETTELCWGCSEASGALRRFMATFLTWKSAQMGAFR
jgi:hypothetical protein